MTPAEPDKRIARTGLNAPALTNAPTLTPAESNAPTESSPPARSARFASALPEHLIDEADAMFWMARAGKSKLYEDRLSAEGYAVWDSRDSEPLLRWAADDQFRWASLKGLTKLYRKGRIPQLRDIARDDSAPDNLRIVATIAVRINGDDVSDHSLLRWYLESGDREVRLIALGALGRSQTASAREVVARAVNDEDLSVALVAVMAAGQQKNRDALPHVTEWLSSLLDTQPWWDAPTRSVKTILLRALTEIGGPVAARAAVGALRAELARSAQHTRGYIRYSTWSLEQITGVTWSGAGAQSTSVRQGQARAALEWWERGGYRQMGLSTPD